MDSTADDLEENDELETSTSYIKCWCLRYLGTDHHLLKEYKLLKQDILQTLTQLEENVLEIKTQVRTGTIADSSKSSTIEDLESNLQQFWWQTDQELHAVEEEMKSMYVFGGPISTRFFLQKMLLG